MNMANQVAGCARFAPLVRWGLRMAALGLLGVCLPGLVSAQALRDPTRPPAQFLDPADAAQAALPPDTGLQTIKRTGKRRAALLHGEWVKPGDMSGEAVVEGIGEQSVVLRYPDGRRETILMYPDVDMKSAKAAKRTAAR